MREDTRGFQRTETSTGFDDGGYREWSDINTVIIGLMVIASLKKISEMWGIPRPLSFPWFF